MTLVRQQTSVFVRRTEIDFAPQTPHRVVFAGAAVRWLPVRAADGPATGAAAHSAAGAAVAYAADINTTGAGVTVTALLSLIRKHQMLLLALMTVVAPCKRFSAGATVVSTTA